MRISIMICLIAWLAGCASNTSEIDIAVVECCPPDKYETFSVVPQDIPAFLGPLMVSNFSVAFANHGMQPVPSEGDLMVVLRYEQVNLSPDRSRGDFEERIGTGDSMRFIARIAIEMRDPETEAIVWSGHIQRLHDVGAGDWMHTGNASQAILQRFTDVLAEYPR